MSRRFVLARAVLAGALIGICSVAVIPTKAHHGFTGRYDVSQPIWLEGVVTAVYFGQPHPTVTLSIPAELSPPATGLDLAGAQDVIATARLTVRPDTIGRQVTVEFPPIRAFFAMDGRVRPGDRVSIIAFRNCQAPHQLRGQWIDPAGEVPPVARSGRVQYQVDGCGAA